MYSYAGGYSTTGHLPFTGETVERAPFSWIVKILRLDEECTAARLPSPAFIKLDVEGHGANAIAGAQNTIARTRPLILAGLHSHEENDGIDRILLPLGYRKTGLDGHDAIYTSGLLDAVYRPQSDHPHPKSASLRTTDPHS